MQETCTAIGEQQQKHNQQYPNLRPGSTWLRQGDSWQTVKLLFHRNRRHCSLKTMSRAFLIMGRAYQHASPVEREELHRDGILGR